MGGDIINTPFYYFPFTREEPSDGLDLTNEHQEVGSRTMPTSELKHNGYKCRCRECRRWRNDHRDELATARLNGELTLEQKQALDRHWPEDRREALRQRAKAAGLPEDARFGALLGGEGGMPLSAADEAIARGSARGTRTEASEPKIRKRVRSPEEMELMERAYRFFGIEEPVKPFVWVQDREEGLTNYQTSEETERIMRKYRRR